MGQQTQYRPEPLMHGTRHHDGLGGLLGRMIKIQATLEGQIDRPHTWPQASHVFASLIHEYRQCLASVAVYPYHALHIRNRLDEMDTFETMLVKGDCSAIDAASRSIGTKNDT